MSNEEIRRRMTTTPAQALPRLEPPGLPESPEEGWIAHLLERVAAVERELGMRPHRTGPYTPLPGSDVAPLDETLEE